jgi:predicted secreted hydrolase
VKGHVSWTHEAEVEIHGGQPVNDSVQTMYGRDFSLGHFNQHGRVHGEIRVGDESWAIDGRGWRDHSWGPRYWQVIYFYRLFIANFPNGDGFMLLKITDQQGKVRREGVLLVDGKYEDILDMDVITEWTDQQDPKRVQLGVMTANRKVRIDAEILTLAPLRNRRKADGETLVSRISEGYTRFTWGEQVGYGMTEYIERIEDGKYAGFPL